MGIIRPATILSVLLFAAFGLLVISVLSVPVIKQVALAENRNVKFGVFGYCQSGNDCTGVQIGYRKSGLILFCFAPG